MALVDLNEALRLSDGGGKVGCQALCQHGLLMRKNGDIESARADFAKATKLGSQFARTQVSNICICKNIFKKCIYRLNVTTTIFTALSWSRLTRMQRSAIKCWHRLSKSYRKR